LHCGTPSHEVRDGKLYLTLLRSIVLLSGDGIMGPCIPTPNANEMGLQTFRYSILPHRKSWRESETYRRAAEINMPLKAMQVIAAEKQEDNSEIIQEFSHTFLKIEPRNILLSTIRSAAAASDSAVEIIIRIYETEGRKTIARLHFDRLVKRVYLLDMLENELGKGTDIGRETLEIEVRPFKVITLKVQF
jgi:alpha-mannosidase